jgi:GntR family transcriptional regulator, transcriptional repressor for pyruvate dehydrogenase complex
VALAFPSNPTSRCSKEQGLRRSREQIERLILKKLKPGDKLPSERELADMLQVSRSSIRDAIRGLELMGLVEPRQGAGTIVREISADSSVNPFSNALKQSAGTGQRASGFSQDARATPGSARRHARFSRRDLGDGRDSATAGTKAVSWRTTIAEDAEFHYSVALASGNSVVLKVLDILMDLLRETRERSLQVEGRPQKVAGWPPADSGCDQAPGCRSRKGSHAAAH